MGFGVDQFFPLLESLELLAFAHIEGAMSNLPLLKIVTRTTDILRRKEIFAEHVIRHITLAASSETLSMNALVTKPQKIASCVSWRPFLAKRKQKGVLRMSIGRGRYSERFAYEKGFSILSLENPESLTTTKIKIIQFVVQVGITLASRKFEI